MRTNTRVTKHLHVEEKSPETTRTSGGSQASAVSRLCAASFINKEEIKRMNLSVRNQRMSGGAALGKIHFRSMQKEDLYRHTDE